MTGIVVSNAVTLEGRRDELAYQLHCVEVKLQGELVGVGHQIAEGKFVPPEIASGKLCSFRCFHHFQWSIDVKSIL